MKRKIVLNDEQTSLSYKKLQHEAWLTELLSTQCDTPICIESKHATPLTPDLMETPERYEPQTPTFFDWHEGIELPALIPLDVYDAMHIAKQK